MKVRSVANGNIIDLPEGHGLIEAGIYEPVALVDDDELQQSKRNPVVDEEEEEKKPPARKSALRSPEKPVETVAHTEPPKPAPARARRPKPK